MKKRLDKIDSGLFTFEMWSKGLYPNGSIESRRKWITEHAIGWCNAEALPIRPRTRQVAIMFRVKAGGSMGFWTALEDEEFWLHLNKSIARDLFILGRC